MNGRLRGGLPLLAALAMSTALGSSVALPAGARAQTTTEQAAAQHSFAIAPQTLPDALTQFGRQSGMQVSVHGDLVRGLTTGGVTGTMTADAALARLLAGTGLAHELGSSGAVIRRPGGAPQSSTTTLGPITVEGTSAFGDRSGAADQAASLYVTQEDLERRNPTTVKDVFAGEASVSVGGAQPLSQKVYVHGVEETNLAVTIDGARQNNKVFHHAGTNLIDPSLLKSVRVDPGVAPADAGPGALGGAIVYETVDVDDVLAPGRSVGGFATASYDTNSSTFTNGLSAYGRAGGFEGLGYVKYGFGDDYEDGDGEQVPGTGTDLVSFLTKGGYQSDSGHRLEVSAERVLDDDVRPFRANMRGLTNRNEPAVRDYRLERQNFVLNYATPQATGLWDPKVVIGYGVSELDVPQPYGSVGTTGSFSAKAENDFNLGRRDTITAGVDFYDDFARYEDPIDDIEERASNVGLYAQARLNPLDPLRLSFGVRGDQQWFEGVDGTEIESAGLSGNASAAYDVTRFLTLKAGVSRVWGGVALAENFILNPNWSYAGDIDPVTSENATIGFDVHHAGFTFGAGLFRSDFENARDPSYGGGPALTADFVTEGYDVSAGYSWGPGFVRVTYTDSTIEVNGAPADSDVTQYLGAPIGRVIAVEAAHSFTDMGLTIGGTIDAALENTDTEDAGGRKLEAYEVLSLFAEYRPGLASFLTLRIEANNVLDAAYADRATYGQDFTNVRPLMEPGRSFLLRAKAEF